jgi:hypothetical protein
MVAKYYTILAKINLVGDIAQEKNVILAKQVLPETSFSIRAGVDCIA